jgi:type II secretory pathway component GspD/PulD (secretin)
MPAASWLITAFVLASVLNRADGAVFSAQTQDPQPAGKEKAKKPQLDAKLQEQIDKLLDAETARLAKEARKRAAQRRARDGTDKPTPEPASKQRPVLGPGAGVKGKGAVVPATTLDIAPDGSDVPPEERRYRFSIKDGTYEQLVDAFARMTGLGVLGETPKDGKVSFVSTQELSFDEALARVRMLLFKYKAHEPYWMFRRETHLEVSRVNDFYRLIPRDHMFRSVEEFRAANLSDDELALVIYTPTSGDFDDLRVVRDFMPDYVRVAPLGGSSVTIFALVKDINKYLNLIPIFVGYKDDPRTLERIELKYILPSRAVEKLRELTDLGGGGVRPRPSTRSRGKDISPLQTMRVPDVKLIPDDAQGVLLVRAMQDKIEEIKRLLPYVDVDTSPKGVKPVVIPVEHAKPSELVSTIQQILAAVSSPTQTGGTPKPRTSTRKTSRSHSSSAPLTVGGVHLLVHPSGNAIIVIAKEEEIERVRELVKQFDVPTVVGPIRIAIAHADPDELSSTITTVFGGGGPRVKGQSERLRIVREPNGNAVWFTGSRKDFERVKDLIALLDVPGQRPALHIAYLRHQQPSFVATILREFDKEAGTSVGSAVAASKRGRSISASKFTPNDEQNHLFILCTEAEWEAYTAVIRQLEVAGEERQPFVRVPVEHIDPAEAVDRLALLLAGGGRSGPANLVPTDGGILVLKADEVQVEEIRALLKEIDTPRDIVQRTFDIRYRGPGEIKTLVETFVGGDAGGGGGGRRPRPDGRGASLQKGVTIVQLGNSLVVRAAPDKMKEVAALIAELDVEDSRTELKVYDDFPPSADIASISEALSSVFSARGAPRRPKAGAAMGSGPRFLPQPSTGKLVIIADPTMFPEIEELLDALCSAVAVTAREVVFIEVAHANPDDLVEQITPLLRLHIRELLDTGQLRPLDKTRAGTLKTVPRRAGQPADTSPYYHLAPDARNGRIVIAAPKLVIDYVRRLVTDFDKPGSEEDVIVRTVLLEQANSAEMVKAIREMISSAGRSRPRRPKPAGARAGDAGEHELVVVEAPGGGAVVLRGIGEDVERARDWIERLDAIATRGRAIKVYDIQYADIKALGNLIMNVVDRPTSTGRLTPGRTPRLRKGMEAIEEMDEFELTKTWTGADIYIQADLIASTMLVAAPEAKLAEVDSIVEQFTTPPTDGEPNPLGQKHAVPSFMYELKYAEAMDAAFELEMLLDQLWQPPNEVPQVESALFGNFLIIKYPREERFPEIKEFIRRYVDKRPEEYTVAKRKGITPPAGMSALDTARWIKMNRPELDVEIIDETPSTDETYNLERLKPPERSRVNPCVLPLALARRVSEVLVVVPGQAAPDAQRSSSERPAQTESDADSEAAGDLLEAAARELLETGDARENATPGGPGGAESADAFGTAEKIRIRVNNNTGEIIIEGSAGVLEDVPDWMEDLEEEIEKLKRPPDIRVIRVRYIDVYSAAEVIEEMFNATQQQRQVVAAARRRQQQVLRQQQQQRQRKQQQQQRQAGQQAGQPARPGQRGQQPQAALPQLPEPAVRVFPNPRDRTLILRAEASQYPAILELLATIDQPQPIDSELRTFKLNKLNAADVEEVLRNMLGLDGQARSSGATSRAGRRPGQAATRRASGGQLPQTILQPTVSGTNMLGVDAKDIKLSSNEASNTIVAMAPKKALEFIGKLIKQLESEEIPERLTRYYDLKHAKVEEVADYLETQFDAGRRPGRTGKAAKGAAPVASLNTPSFVPYPRLNMLTVLATQEQLSEIDGIIDRLDVSGEESAWKDVTLAHADAGTVADTLAQMFGGGAPKGRGRKGGAAPAAADARFIGEQGGRMLLFNAPQSLHEPILAAIEKLEAEAKDATSVRIVRLKYATPSKVADALEAVNTGRHGGKPGKRAGRARFMVTAHDPSRQLFIQADDDTFEEIESLLSALDKPSDIGFEFRVYPLQYANARQVHAQMTKLMADYLKRLGPGSRPEPFSVEVDDRANALVVLGTPTVFGFLEENLPKIDNPANAVGRVGSLTVALKNARAEEVAATINRLYGAKKSGSTETPPQAEANRSLNLLIVRGTQKQLDEIRKEIIDPVQEQGAAVLSTETIKLQFADPDAVAEAINRFFEDKQRAYKSMGSAASVSPVDLVAVVTPDSSTGQVIIQAGEENMRLAKARIAELDREDVAARVATTVKIYTIKYADPDALVRIINDWSKSRPRAGGSKKGARPGDVVNASAEPISGSVVVTAGAANHLIIQEMIERLDSSDAGRQEVHVLNLSHADAESVVRTLTEIFVRGAPRSGARVPPISIAALQGSKSVLVKCKDELFADIEAVIAELDTEEAVLGETVSIVQLSYADAAEVEASLREYLKKPGGRGGELAGGTRLSVLSQSNAIVVSGDKAGVQRLEELARQLDGTGEKGSVPQIIRLKHASAGQLASTLQEMFAEQRGGRRGRTPPVIKPNDAIGALIVRASPTDFTAIQAIIEQLDTEEAALQKNFRIVQVTVGVNVEDMADKVQEAINEGARAQAGKRRGGDVPSVRIIPDRKTQTLIVSGAPELFGEAEEMIRAMEKLGPAGGQGFKVIRLANTPAEDIERLIALLKGEQSSGKGRARRSGGSRRPKSVGRGN